MDEQIGLPYVKGSDTSRAAARNLEVQPEKLSAMHARLVVAYADAGPRGLTDNECQARLAMGGSTQRPRRVELARAGMIRKNGERRSGSAVWVLA